MLRLPPRLFGLLLLFLFATSCGSSLEPVAVAEAATTEAADSPSTTAEPATTTTAAPSTTTAAPATSKPAPTTVDSSAEFEDVIVERTEEASALLDELTDRDIDSSLPVGERVMLILELVGTGILTETTEGQCLVESVSDLPAEAIAELEQLDALPSPSTLAELGETTRNCGVLRHIAASFQAGLVSSGGTPDMVDVECIQTNLSQDDATVLFITTGNSSALDIPEFVDADNTAVLVFTVYGPCLNYGNVAQAIAPMPLLAESIECVNEWGKAEARVARLFAGDMSQEEFGAALQGCLTPEELEAIGW